MKGRPSYRPGAGGVLQLEDAGAMRLRRTSSPAAVGVSTGHVFVHDMTHVHGGYDDIHGGDDGGGGWRQSMGGEQERWRRRAGIPVLYNQPPRDLVAPSREGNSAQHSSSVTAGRLPESMKPPSSAKASLRARAPFASQLQRHHYERSVTPGVVDYRTQPGEYDEESCKCAYHSVYW